MGDKPVLLKSPNASDISILGEEFQTKSFPDGESYIRIPVSCSGKKVFVLHRCYPEPDSSLIQLFLVLKQLKEMGASEITAIVPYLPYARQDKRFLEGEAMSSSTICRIMKSLGCDKLITFDCHFLKKEGDFVYGGLNIKNISLGKKVADKLRKGLKDTIVISPDEGARYLTEKERNSGVMKKVRGEYGGGKSAYREISSLKAEFDVENKNVIILDDMIAGGSTMIKALKLCRDKKAKTIRCGAVHGLFLNDALKKLKDNGASDIACTNSIPSDASAVDISEALRGLI